MEVLQLGQNPNGKEALALQDSLGKTAAYLYQGDNIGYNSRKVGLAKKTIDEAISKFPDRLDLRFGKVYMLGELQQWTPFTEEIVKTLDRSSKNKNAWKWRDDKPVEEAQNFLIGNVQSYFNQLYDTEDDALLSNMQTISETVLKYYPNDVMNLSNLGAIRLMKSDFDAALPLFLKAEKLSPEDGVVINNIALCYEKKGDKKNAIAYYSKLLVKADAGTKAKIEARIRKINE
jgi:tetratricopeptide (TPR) repeat protein